MQLNMEQQLQFNHYKYSYFVCRIYSLFIICTVNLLCSCAYEHPVAAFV